jgi:histidinol dehydrogenase
LRALRLARDAAEACALADEIAPEHLHVAAKDAESLLDQIPHAGAAFVGHFSPVAAGDYAAGPSHVLPTGGAGRFRGGLSASDFVRVFSVQTLTRRGLHAIGPSVVALARAEGLTAHAASVERRIQGR